ncbi:MAG TPA: LPO_1073/Vpar_1526 family protein [Longimicrobiaceae bacterium]|jgi:hypothetical protein|nr:LPO_1073/Vpar_1526 family protein [Longimicrobiaceae bacterium]
MEPSEIIAGGVISGVAGEVAKALYVRTAQPLIERYFGKHLSVAHSTAESNVLAFLAVLAQNLKRGEHDPTETDTASKVTQGLEDPDAAFTFRQAILSGARTSSRERHAILARAISERLSSDSGSTKAVASNQAVELVHSLSGAHLELLGLIALLYHIRPWHLVPPDAGSESEAVDRSEAANQVGQQQAVAYGIWFREQLKLYSFPIPGIESHLIHLSGSACIVFERKVRRNFYSATRPYRKPVVRRVNTPFYMALPYELGSATWEFVDGATRFDEFWERYLQHAFPTPVGMLIGVAVHGIKSGEELLSGWEWSEDFGLEDATVNDDIWDGKEITEKFLSVLDRAIVDRAQRRVRPWAPLDE